LCIRDLRRRDRLGLGVQRHLAHQSHENGTTSGGILGGRLHFTAVSATVWQVDGLLIGSGYRSHALLHVIRRP
jgi:hypothetical protein